MVFVAEDDHGELLGFATVTHDTHFTGARQASIGELATSESAEGYDVGKALLHACEQRARDQGYPCSRSLPVRPIDGRLDSITISAFMTRTSSW